MRRCRNAKGRFTKCRKGTSGVKKRSATKRKGTGRVGRCLKWSKGRTRCLKRKKS